MSSASKKSKPSFEVMDARLGLGYFKVALAKLNVPYDKNASKSELQALWTLHQFDLMDFQDVLKPKITLLWEMTTAQQVTALRRVGLRTSGIKWDRVKVMVYLLSEKKHILKKAKGKETLKDILNLLDKKGRKATSADPEAVSLLLASVYTFVHQYGVKSKSLSRCPKISKPTILKIIDSIPAIKTEEHLKSLFSSHAMLGWVCSAHRNLLVLATGDMVIPGFASSVLQFIVREPNKTLRVAFEKEKAKTKAKSTVLFHGTPLANLLSILWEGFRTTGPSGPYLWMASYPQYSYTFINPRPSTTVGGQWKNSPYAQYGALLGCEVVGMGREVGAQTVHTFKSKDMAIVRYVFLVPLAKIAMDTTAPRRAVAAQPPTAAPTRATIKLAMLKAFSRAWPEKGA